jgi:hypothetical protein
MRLPVIVSVVVMRPVLFINVVPVNDPLANDAGTPVIVPPVMATALADCVDILPRLGVIAELGIVDDAVITPAPLPKT